MTKQKKSLKTLVAISQEFNLHRNTVSKWFSRPDAPKRKRDGYGFAEVTAFIETCAKTETTISKGNPKMAEAKLTEVLERIRRLKIANDEAAGKTVPIEWVTSRNNDLSRRFKDILYSKLVDELPAELSNDVPTNRVLLRNVVDRLLAEVGSWASVWKRNPDLPPAQPEN
jgi:hypothetical protein